MKKKLLLSLSSVVMAFTITGTAFAESVENAPTGFVATTLGEVENTPVQQVEIENISEEEFYEGIAKASGKSVSQVRAEYNPPSSQLNRAAAAVYVYRTYRMLIDLGGNIKAQSGAYVRLQQIQIGASVQYVFDTVDTNTLFLNPYSGGSYTIIKNFVAGTINTSNNTMTLTADGLAETAVTSGVSSGLGISAGELINIGWSLDHEVSSTQYYRRTFHAVRSFTAAEGS